MHSLGIISNPRSRGHLDGHAALGAAADGLPHAAPDGQPALHEALARFAGLGVTLLVVNGGDGTLREVLGALPVAWPGPPPAVAPLAAGRTNLMARTLGQRGRGEAAFHRLRQAAAGRRLRQDSRPVLEVTRLGGVPQAPLRGLLFGAAGFTHATRLAQGGLHQRSLQNNAAVGVTALLTAVQTLSGHGPQARILRQGTPMRVVVEGGAADDGTGGAGAGDTRFILLATTLDRLMLGLWPFWGTGPGPLHWLDVAAPPARLAHGLWSMLRRRPPGTAGWRSGRAGQLRIALQDAFVLDGEVFEPGPKGLLLTASAPVTFVAP